MNPIFLSLTETHTTPEPNTGCLLWTGATSLGYGTITVKGQKHSAHRLSYELNVGQIPSGMFICHKCDTPQCVNPDHLFAGTHRDNMRDCVAKKRTASGVNHSQSKLTEIQVKEIAEDRSHPENISKKYGVCLTTVRSIKSGKTWKHVEADRFNGVWPTESPGEEHGCSKLNEHAVEEILFTGKSSAQLSAEYGVRKDAINRIRNGGNWARAITRILGVG